MITALEVINLLKNSSAYNNALPENKKYKVLYDAWGECLVLNAEFDPDGTKQTSFNDRKTTLNGFGHLVEIIARHEPDLPRNTANGERLSQTILGFLQKGSISKSDIKISGSRRVPDQILIEYSGRRAEVWGLCEVKASHLAYDQSGEQISNLETSLRLAVNLIDKKRHSHKNLRKIKVVVRDPLKKFLITPAGFDNLIELPPDWEHHELKFTYNELCFIAKLIWPKFKPTLSFESGLLGRYRQEFMRYFLKWGNESVFKEVVEAPFGGSEENLFLFACATQKIPWLETDMNLAATKAYLFKEILFQYPTSILEENNLGDWEKKFYEFFSKALGGGNSIKKQILLFLTNFRNFSVALARICQEEIELDRILARSDDFNIIDYCPK